MLMKESLYAISGKRMGESNFAPHIDLKMELGKVIGNDFNIESEPSWEIRMHLPKVRFHILVKGHNNTEGGCRILARKEK